MASQLITVHHINTIRTVGGRGGNEKRVRMLTIDGGQNRKAYRVDPSIEEKALSDLYSSKCENQGTITIEVTGKGESARVTNYYL